MISLVVSYSISVEGSRFPLVAGEHPLVPGGCRGSGCPVRVNVRGVGPGSTDPDIRRAEPVSRVHRGTVDRTTRTMDTGLLEP